MTQHRSTAERERRVVLALFVVGLLAGGCDVSHVVSSSGAGGAGGTTFYNPDAGYPGDVMPLTATESWTGYVENYQFASGSSAVKLSFATDPSGLVVGTVTFGAGAPPPPATDPNATYPPGPTQILPNTIVEGFPYRIAMGALTGAQLDFHIWDGEVWAGWCALQTPIPNDRSCLPLGTDCSLGVNRCFYSNPQTGVSTPISDAKVELCNREVCVCDGAGCVWHVNESVAVDLALSGTTGSGRAVPLDGDVRTVQLTKD